MKLAKRNPLNVSPVDAFDRIFDDMLGSPLGFWNDSFWNKPLGSLRTPLDDFSYANVAQHPVRKTQNDDGSMVIEFDVPGLDKKDLQLSYEDNVLAVTSNTKEESEKGTATRKISYKIYAPDLDVDTIEATCDRGVLTVNASPIKEAINKHTIEIK